MLEQMQEMTQQDVLFSISHKIGFIELNRQRALNALNQPMMTAIAQQLLAWKSDGAVQAVVVHSNSPRAFCAGGDLRAVYEAGTQGHLEHLDHLFREEYILNHIIKTYPKPYISFMDGIAMGGGIGLSVHGSHRLMSENVLVAMPETNIGYFPDVGATHFLNQAPGKVGLYLALTGNHIKVADALYARIGTHYIPHEKQAQVFDELKKLPCKDHSAIDTFLKLYDEPRPESPLARQKEEIDQLFTATTIGGIFSQLKASSSEFSQGVFEILKKRSPTSLAVAFEQMNRWKTLNDFSEVMSMEFDMSQRFIKAPDFFEGIRAVIIDKDHAPKWSPADLKEVTKEQVAMYFIKQDVPLDVES